MMNARLFRRLRRCLGCLVLAMLPGLAGAQAAAERWQENSELAQRFAALHTQGTLVVYDSSQQRWTAVNARRAYVRYLPASTFKIPATLIALESSVARDDQQAFAWDGKTRSYKAWNADQTLTSAFRYSTVWVYQSIARSVGPARMQQWLHALRYGNAVAGPQPDQFWLAGELRISAVEQVEFLRRLHDGALPLSARTLGLARQVMEREHSEGYRLFAKTGLTGDAAPTPDLGWYVGWLEWGDTTVFFALNMDCPSEAQVAQREPLTRAMLRALGYPIALAATPAGS